VTEQERLDSLLVRLLLADSRERAKAMIMAGEVLVNGVRIDKPGVKVKSDSEIKLLGGGCPYVSRGGLKLERAIESFKLDLTGAVVLDIGSSTGGFTDCVLKHGAARVYAVDVGYGQLAFSLRQDPRVVCLERTNARYLTLEQLGEKVDLVTIDASFISLAKLLPAALPLVKPGGSAVTLIKPQFEAGRSQVGKNGVVRDPLVQAQVIENVGQAARELGWVLAGLDHSPVKGPKGNIEFVALLRPAGEEPVSGEEVRRVVETAHHDLK